MTFSPCVVYKSANVNFKVQTGSNNFKFLATAWPFFFKPYLSIAAVVGWISTAAAMRGVSSRLSIWLGIASYASNVETLVVAEAAPFFCLR